MIDMTRFVSKIKDSRAYLFEKFIRTCKDLKDKEWRLNVDLYCSTGMTFFTFAYKDIVKREHIEIKGCSDIEFVEITYADIDMLLHEYENLYSIGLSIYDESEDELYSELNSIIPEFINETKAFYDYKTIIEKFHCLSDASLKEMCGYIKMLIRDSELEIKEVEREEDDYNICYYYKGETSIINIQIKIFDDDALSGEESIDEKYYIFDDIHEEAVHDCLIVTFYDTFRIIYKGNNIEEIRGLIDENDPEPEIRVEDFLVKVSVFQCINRDHHLTKVKALVHIDTGYRIVDYQANALFCPECDQYYITEAEYARVESIGRICCKLITVEEYKKIRNSGYDTWAEQSLLKCYGYTVNATDNLSAKERQRILSFIIENDIMSIRRVIDFISWLIGRPGGYNLANARRKWQEDIDYLQHYVPAENVAIVGSFVKKRYKSL